MPQQLAEEVFLVGLGLALIVGITFVHLKDMASALQKATAVANYYHGSAIRLCNDVKLIVDALDTHESHDGVDEVRKALQKVQEAAVAAAEAFAAVLLKVTKDKDEETFKEKAEIVSNAIAETSEMCLRSIGDAEAKLRAATAQAGRAAAAAAAMAQAAALGRLVEALKPRVLMLDATPIEVQQWKSCLCPCPLSITSRCRSLECN